MEQILRDIEAMPGMKLPKNRRQRRTLLQNGYKSDVAEAYSPPRVTAIASSMKLRPAFAIDLTVIDEVDDKPFDFRSQTSRRGRKTWWTSMNR